MGHAWRKKCGRDSFAVNPSIVWVLALNRRIRGMWASNYQGPLEDNAGSKWNDCCWRKCMLPTWRYAEGYWAAVCRPKTTALSTHKWAKLVWAEELSTRSRSWAVDADIIWPTYDDEYWCEARGVVDPCDVLEKQLKKHMIVGVKESWAAGPMSTLH